MVDRVTFQNPENGFCVLRVKARGPTRPDHGHRPRRNDLGRRVHPSERLLDNDRTHGRPALKELNGIIDGDRYFLSDRIRTLKAIRSKIRPEPAPTPLPPPPKRYAPPRDRSASRRSNRR